MRVAEQIGCEFQDHESIDYWRQTGAEIDGQRVRIGREELLALIDRPGFARLYCASVAGGSSERLVFLKLVNHFRRTSQRYYYYTSFPGTAPGTAPASTRFEVFNWMPARVVILIGIH